jgi:hypothetical protein
MPFPDPHPNDVCFQAGITVLYGKTAEDRDPPGPADHVGQHAVDL